MSDTAVDWSVLDLDGVREVALQAARRVHRRYEQHVELEDLKQEALILLGTTPNLQEPAQAGELGLLQYRLEQDIVERIETEVRRATKQISYSRIEEQEEPSEGVFVKPVVIIETSSNDYTRESVESLLPAVWDETLCYGLPRKDTAPDPDMPRSTPNKSHGNTLSAYIADIKTGWNRAPLTVKERRALLLAFGLGWTQKQIAYNQGISQQAVSARIYTGVGKIVARLNGGLWAELEGIEA